MDLALKIKQNNPLLYRAINKLDKQSKALTIEIVPNQKDNSKKEIEEISKKVSDFKKEFGIENITSFISSEKAHLDNVILKINNVKYSYKTIKGNIKNLLLSHFIYEKEINHMNVFTIDHTNYKSKLKGNTRKIASDPDLTLMSLTMRRFAEDTINYFLNKNRKAMIENRFDPNCVEFTRKFVHDEKLQNILLRERQIKDCKYKRIESIYVNVPIEIESDLLGKGVFCDSYRNAIIRNKPRTLKRCQVKELNLYFLNSPYEKKALEELNRQLLQFLYGNSPYKDEDALFSQKIHQLLHYIGFSIELEQIKEITSNRSLIEDNQTTPLNILYSHAGIDIISLIGIKGLIYQYDIILLYESIEKLNKYNLNG